MAVWQIPSPKGLDMATRRATPRTTEHARLLGLAPSGLTELLRQVEEGFPYRLLENFHEAVHLPMCEIGHLVRIPARTLHRRKKEGMLQPEESDRLLRASRVFRRALDLFEDDLGAAKRWLSTPQPALGGLEPLEMARTDLGAQEVERLIGQLEHGVFP